MRNKTTLRMTCGLVAVMYVNATFLVYDLSKMDYFDAMMSLACCIALLCTILIINNANADYNFRINSNLKYFKYRASILAKPGMEKLSIINCQNAYRLGRK